MWFNNTEKSKAKKKVLLRFHGDEFNIYIVGNDTCRSTVYPLSIFVLVLWNKGALRYKPEGRWVDSRWCHWNLSGRTNALGSTQLLTEMSTRNISWGEGARCVGLTTLTPSCADCLEIWEPQPPGTLRACPGL